MYNAKYIIFIMSPNANSYSAGRETEALRVILLKSCSDRAENEEIMLSLTSEPSS